jgi:Cu2+-containing amine oxidase
MTRPQGFFFLKRGPLDNEYAHPLDLTVIVDLNEEKVRGSTTASKPATHVMAASHTA